VPNLNLQPHHKAVRAYYAELQQYSLLHATHEGAVSAAFGTLLQSCAQQHKWTLINQYEIRHKTKGLRVDGALVDHWCLTRGFWEAKDENDDLAVEAKKKIDLGYPTSNILFQAPDRAILYQNGKRVLDESLEKPQILVDVIKAFFGYEEPQYERWEQAVAEFKNRVPELARALEQLIEREREYPHFKPAFDRFAQVCRTSLNPQLTDDAVEKMLVQHILTERIFSRVFDNPEFVRRNVIAQEIELVIDKLTQRSFNRKQFLGGLDRFYRSIEETAATIDDFADKQHFLNSVYEDFFQGFDEKTADTHGIVYTPQPIVRFMVKSVKEILEREFGTSFGAPGVHILDPFVGTGNFLLSVMREIPKTRIEKKYASELHANEVMLLPYYITSMNIEHEYAELTGEYRPFEGLCLVDTFELSEDVQGTFAVMTEANTKRVEIQKKAPITVIIGNPPYNAWQVDENDGNKNRKYKVLDRRVAETYAKASKATLVNSLSDPYVKAFRWATDRLGGEGVLAYVSNKSYVDQFAFDGMRQHLARDFDTIYIVDLGGNVRKNPKLSGTTHNVFGIQVGVCIGFFVRRKEGLGGAKKAEIFYARTGEDWRKEQKYAFLDSAGAASKLEWTRIEPDERDTWLTEGLRTEFDTFLPLVTNAEDGQEPKALFGLVSNGIKSNNDAYVFGFDRGALELRARAMVDAYNDELARWNATAEKPKDVDAFLKIDEHILKWVRKTKRYFSRGKRAAFQRASIVPSLYRPFVRKNLFFDRMFSEDVYSLPQIFSTQAASQRALVVSGVGMRSPFAVLAARDVPEQHLCASTDAFQVLPWMVSSDEGMRDNVTDWALTHFRGHYGDPTITKWQVFHYVYGLLHHPDYRTRYAANLKRELPRIPFAPDFYAFATAGEKLVELHLDYDEQKEYALNRIENPHLSLDWRVKKMRLSKDRTSLVYSEFLTLSGIPPEAFEYRLGNRSALEWVIDQYQVSVDKRSGIVDDPNSADDPERIVRLVGQVVTVSIETMRIVKRLPPIEMSPDGSTSPRDYLGEPGGRVKERLGT
jgi:predicted helicase